MSAAQTLWVPSSEQIIAASADEFGVRAADILGRSRWKTIAIARHVAVHLCRKVRRMSLLEIGHAMGHRDHTSAMHSCNVVRCMVDEDADFRARVLRVELAAMHAAQQAHGGRL